MLDMWYVSLYKLVPYLAIFMTSVHLKFILCLKNHNYKKKKSINKQTKNNKTNKQTNTNPQRNKQTKKHCKWYIEIKPTGFMKCRNFTTVYYAKSVENTYVTMSN